MLKYISRLPSDKFAATWPRRVTVLGSTGSIGQSALAVLEGEAERFEVLALAGWSNVEALTKQALRWRPLCLGIGDEAGAAALRLALAPAKGYKPQIFVGQAGYAELAALPEADLVLSAQSGAAGLSATYAAVKAGKVTALANKESLVLAGGIIRTACNASGSAILPVDSEHSAIFQCLCGQNGLGLGANGGALLKRVILTASGGPFWGRSAASLAGVTRAEALAHPTWSMGRKISVDSATFMNKGMEYVEACHLFGLAPDQVEVLVHPQSIVHSIIEYTDNSSLAQLGVPDMRIPISSCLSWPQRINSGAAELNLAGRSLTFLQPDLQAFPALTYWKEAHTQGCGLSIALNAANEVAVDMFLRESLDFAGITRLARLVMEAWSEGAAPGDIDEVLGMDARARALAIELAK